MKLKTLLLAGAATSLLAGSAFAQAANDAPATEQRPGMEQRMDTPSTGTNTDAAATRMDADTTAAMGTGMTFEDLNGADVVDAENSTLATISDVLIGEDGQSHYLVLSAGGMLGVGATLYTYEIDSFPTVNEDGDVQLSGLTKEAIEALPEYEYPSDDGSQAQAQAPAQPAGTPASDAANRDMAAAPATTTEEGRAATDMNMETPAAASLWPVSLLVDAEIHDSASAPADAASAPASPSASAPAQDSNDNQVNASVEDIRFDADGKVAAFILNEGGLFGLGAEEREIPFERVTISGTQSEPRLMVSGLATEMNTAPSAAPDSSNTAPATAPDASRAPGGAMDQTTPAAPAPAPAQ